MNQKIQKHILLCVTGMTPQIITETLQALIEDRKERVDEIRVITTIEGRNRIKQDLLGENKSGKFFEFCQDRGIEPRSIKFDETCIALLRTPDGCTMEDIRTAKDNENAGNQICDIVRELTKDQDTRIHASAAGGRKTMSVYLTAAMQLFGRAQDCLSHVLVSEDFEGNKEFYFKPRVARTLRTRDGREVSTADAEVYLADIPFIRLSAVLPDWLRDQGMSYIKLVEQAQLNLNMLEGAHDLKLHLRGNMVEVAGRKITLSRKEFFYYLLFALLRVGKRSDEGFVAFEEVTVEDLDRTFRMITSARGQERGLEDYQMISGFEFLRNLEIKVRDKASTSPVDLQNDFLQVIAKIKNKLDKAGRLDLYHIINEGKYGASRYGLNVAPERIVISS